MKMDQRPNNSTEQVERKASWWRRGWAVLAGLDEDPLASAKVAPSLELTDDRERIAGYAWAALACVLVTVLELMLRDLLASANLVLLYLVAVVLIAVRYGRKPAILASFLAVLAFDVFLIPPYYSLAVADPQYFLTFAIMLMVALIISSLTANLRHQARIAHYRERRTSALFDLSKALSVALTNEQIVDIGITHLEAMFPARVTLLLPDRQGSIQPPAASTAATVRVQEMLKHAQEVYDRQNPDGFSGDVDHILYLPLCAPMRTRGVLVAVPDDERQLLLPDQQRLLQTCAALIALAIERVHYVDVAREAELAMESERLRNSLLSAISHDVRTPLTAIVGLSSALIDDKPMSHEMRQELIGAIQDEALRMSSLVTNLLDMAKLHAGGVRLNRQWQLLEEVVGSALTMMSRTLDGRPIHVGLPRSMPLLEFDAVLLERVFCNLLDNAAKYTPSGSALWINAATKADEVLVSVEDSGTGVPEEMAAAIFEKFLRGEPESARPGVGLGLSICRAIVEAHGGRIWMQNRNEGGASFVFSLPMGSPPPGIDFTDPIEPATTT